MKDWKTILSKIIWTMAGLAMLVLFVYSWQAKTEKVVNEVFVELVGNNTSVLFMDEIDIKVLLNDMGVEKGIPVASLNLVKIESDLSSIQWVKNAEVFIDNLQQVQVKIEQRIPIARIFTAGGSSFYVDQVSTRLPLKQLSVMRLPVITGFPSDQVVLSKPDSILLQDVLKLANIIQQDSFFSAQIAQVHITTKGEFEIVPTLGDHLVLIGTIDKIEDKLNRLYTFYKKVWVQSGINAFQVLDCRFDHQIVTLKKGLQPIQFGTEIKPFGALGIDTLSRVASVTSLAPIDTAIRAVPKNPVKSLPALDKKVNDHPKKIEKKPLKKGVQKTQKTVKKKSNKQKNNSLKKVKKTAKALLPKKSTSNNN